MIFSLDSAMEYIRGKIQTLFDQSRVLKDRLMTIGQLMKTAQAKQDQAALGRLITLQQQTKDLFIEQLALEQKLMPFANYFGVNVTLGALPIVLAVSAISVATLLYLHFQKLQNQQQALDLVAKGLMTPAEAKTFMDAGSVLGAGGLTGITQNIGMILALLVGGYVLIQVMPRRT